LSAAADPTLTFASAVEWEAWLDESHDSASGVCLKILEKASGIASVTYAEALDVALCFGWIDGQKKSFDERFLLQRLTPWRPRSLWSQRNREHIERLTAAWPDAPGRPARGRRGKGRRALGRRLLAAGQHGLAEGPAA